MSRGEMAHGMYVPVGKGFAVQLHTTDAAFPTGDTGLRTADLLTVLARLLRAAGINEWTAEVVPDGQG